MKLGVKQKEISETKQTGKLIPRQLLNE